MQDPRPRPLSQYSGEPLPLRSDPPLHHLPALRQDADLAFHLVYVDAKMLHGWPPPLRHTTACTIVGLRPPRAVAASRFIPSLALAAIWPLTLVRRLHPDRRPTRNTETLASSRDRSWPGRADFAVAFAHHFSAGQLTSV